MSLSKIAISSILLSGLLFSQPVLATQKSVSQWVKIISDARFEPLYFTPSSDKLEISEISCGNNCKLVKLTTTPFDDNGMLNMEVSNPCSRVIVKLPFHVEGESLVTPIMTYHELLGAEYCSFRYIDIKVTGNPQSGAGYEIHLRILNE